MLAQSEWKTDFALINYRFLYLNHAVDFHRALGMVTSFRSIAKFREFKNVDCDLICVRKFNNSGV